MRACPHCNRKHNAARSPSGEPTQVDENDRAMCVNCGSWMVITQRGLARKPTPEEVEDIMLNPECRTMMTHWAMMRGSVEG